MGLSIGIVGLPNIGKSTVFNALTKAQNAESANYPFCTIEPNKASVPVKDERLEELAKLVNPERIVYATVDFVDIAGLVKGASKGEGLGNKFLANIRETNALLHIVRCFDDDNVVHVDGSVDPLRDIEIVETELMLADLETIDKQIVRVEKLAKADKKMLPIIEKLKALSKHVEAGNLAITFENGNIDDEFRAFLNQISLLTNKPVIYAMNVNEDSLVNENNYQKKVIEHATKKNFKAISFSAKMEEDMIGLEESEIHELLNEYGVKENALDRLVSASYDILGLHSYFTAGQKEVRAWTIKKGTKAPKAAGVIHTDFEKGFIRAQVISYEDYIKYKSEAACKNAGVLRTEGKDYVMRDGDIVEFLFNN
ncbi:MAG: redox-regulated ATPase YchF [Bdellovibrionota bacterium]